MNDCIFCKIINKEISSLKIYEDEDFLAFLDIAQVTKGHTLVVPKQHVRDIFEVDEQLMSKTFALINSLAKDLCEKLGTTGVNILNNNGASAGQTVFHYHVHIIPRYDDSDKIDINFLESGLDAVQIHEMLTK